MVTKELIAQYRQSLPEEMPQENKALWNRYFLKKAAMVIGIGGIISIALQIAVVGFSFLLNTLVPALSALTYGSGWQTEIYTQFNTMLTYIITMFIPYLIVAILLKLPKEELVAAKAPKKGTFLPMLLIGIGTIPLLQYFSVFVTEILSVVRLNTPDSLLEAAFSAPTNPVAIILQIILLCVMAPIFEEFAFRGVIMQSMRRYGDGFAIIASALLFGLMHSNTAQTPFAFIMGLVLGYIVVKTNSIWTAVALHAANNLTSTILGIVEQRIPDENTLGIITMAVWAAFVIAGIVGLILFVISRSSGRFDKLTRPMQKCGIRHPMATFMSRPTIIISVVLYLLMTLMLTQWMQDVLQWLTNYADSLYTY